MAWSGGSFTRSNGVYTGSSVWATDEANSVDIESARHDTHDQDLAAGINNCLTKDGQNSPSSHLNWVNTEFFGTTAGTANVQTLSLPNAPAAYYTGMRVRVKIGAGLTNTGALTLNVNSLGAKAVEDWQSNAFTGYDFQAGGYYDLVYDGTEFIAPYMAAKQTYSPTATLDSGTWASGSETVDAANYWEYPDGWVEVQVQMRTTTSGGPPTIYTCTLPVTAEANEYCVAARRFDSGGLARPACGWMNTTSQVYVTKPDYSNIGVGSNSGFAFQVRYRRAS